MTVPEENEHDLKVLERRLSEISFDLIHLVGDGNANSAQDVSRYIADNSLTIAYFVGLVIDEPSDLVVDLACKCITTICAAIGLVQLAAQGLIDDGLRHPNVRVRKLVLELLVASADVDLRIGVLELTIDCLAMTDSAASAHAALEATFKAAPTAFAKNQPALGKLAKLLNQPDERIRLRVCSLICDLLSSPSSSDAIFTDFENAGLVGPLFLAPLSSTDIMTRLNAIEIISLFADTAPESAPFRYLSRPSGAFEKISAIISQRLTTAANLDASLAQSAAVAFYARLAKSNPSALLTIENSASQQSLLSPICEILLATALIPPPPPDLIHACLICLGNVASSVVGLSLVVARHRAALDVLVEAAVRGIGATKIVAYQSLACIFDQPASAALFSYNSGDTENTQQQQQSTDSVCIQLFDDIGGCLHGIFPAVKSVEQALCIAAYACLKAVADKEWGLKQLRDSGQLIGFILDRATEPRQIVKEWRFSVVEAVVNNKMSKQILPEALFNRFLKYAREGPFYREPVPLVMMESA